MYIFIYFHLTSFFFIFIFFHLLLDFRENITLNYADGFIIINSVFVVS